MEHVQRRRRVPAQDELDLVEDTGTDVEDTEEDVDTSDEPSYERVEGESTKEAQDRIEAKYKARATSPLRAIRAFCVLCMGAQPREVAHCSARGCVLFAFRDGKNPYQRRNNVS